MRKHAHFSTNDGPVFWFRTDLNAPLSRIVAIDTTKGLPAQINELVPESSDKLESVGVVGDRFVALYLKDACSSVKLFKLDGSADGEIALPGIGSAGGFTGKRADRETLYSFTSFTTPTSIFRYDFDRHESSSVFKPKVKFNPDGYTTEQVFYNGADGTRIPMFISYKKGMKRAGQNLDLSAWIRRVRYFGNSGIQPEHASLDGNGWNFRSGEFARRWRIRREMARSRNAPCKTKCVR